MNRRQALREAARRPADEPAAGRRLGARRMNRQGPGGDSALLLKIRCLRQVEGPEDAVQNLPDDNNIERVPDHHA